MEYVSSSFLARWGLCIHVMYLYILLRPVGKFYCLITAHVFLRQVRDDQQLWPEMHMYLYVLSEKKWP